MANIKNLDQSSDKWVRRASVAAPDYTAGIENPRASWEDSAVAADANYRAGVTAAANRGAFASGVRGAGNEKWKRGSLQKGPARFAEGVAIAKDDWARGFSPYREAIAAVKLPPRGPAGSPQNLQRVAAIATALRTLRERRGK